MLTPYESRLGLVWLANAAGRVRHRRPEAAALAEWTEENTEALVAGLAGHGCGISAAELTDAAAECREDWQPRVSRRSSRAERAPECYGDNDREPRDVDALFAQRRERAWERAREQARERASKHASPQAWQRFRTVLRQVSEAAQTIKPDATALRLQRLARITRLDATDLQVVEMTLRYQTQPALESLVDEVAGLGLRGFSRRGSLNLRSPAFANLLGITANTLRSRCAPDAPLARSGLLAVDEDGDVAVTSRMRRLDSAPDQQTDPLPLLLGGPAQPELEWQDFDHLGQQRADVEGLVRGALSKRAKGINILLYGPPGTGKTQFARTLAARLGVALFSAGEADEDGEEPSRSERLADLRLGQNLLRRETGALLLFDEMDDLLGEDRSALFGGFRSIFGRRRRSKAPSRLFMNRLLEENRTPTLWTVNNARGIDRAILRRMMFVIEMRQPPPPVRQRIWARQLEASGIRASAEDARALAYEFDATPGVAAGAVAAAALLPDGDLGAVRRGVQSLSRLLDCEKQDQGVPRGFDPAFMQSDEDLEALADRLAATGKKRFSLCLQGPPGTGKSAWIRYLADRLGLEVTQKRASDLLSMWVGGSEKNIARAFREAKDDGSFLVFDEADSLLADRRGAQRRFEISQVNEMLTWMERHPLPFACTTNLIEKLDPATLRRFVFKISVDYLDATRANAMFRAWFNLPPPQALSTLHVLTPGDFAVARQKAEILDQLDDPVALYALLSSECRAKPDQRRPIGFVT